MAYYYSGAVRKQYETPTGAQFRRQRQERRTSTLISIKVTAAVIGICILAGLAG